ncbi:MAG: hypothetical protein AAF478_13060 [Pseudomonadota bacterium]
MSHEATNWAFEQAQRFPDMKPSEWGILLVLADLRGKSSNKFDDPFATIEEWEATIQSLNELSAENDILLK